IKLQIIINKGINYPIKHNSGCKGTYEFPGFQEKSQLFLKFLEKVFIWSFFINNFSLKSLLILTDSRRSQGCLELLAQGFTSQIIDKGKAFFENYKHFLRLFSILTQSRAHLGLFFRLF
ncbi:MAG: hypothetical protein Q4F52_10180, partial [Bacteroidaceae bacterium]|nr:hypothetical protein [Bacteroidaceae bacterium]